MYNRSVELVFETEPPASASDPPGPYRADDYFTLGEDWRGELLWGHLVVTPSPLALHQSVIVALTRRFSDFALASGHRLLVAPSDVKLFEHTVCQPDLLLIHRDRREIVHGYTVGTPDLAVEVLSKSSARRDRALKLEIYARAGLPEYWLVDPQARLLELRSLAGEGYRLVPHPAHRAASLRFPELELDLEALWDEVDRLETGRLPG